MTWENPFEETVFEDWRTEEHPERYIEAVKCFIRPEFMNNLELSDIKPKIIMGGRGSGKSHILNILSAESVIAEIKIEKSKKLNIEPDKIKITPNDFNKPYFGVWIRCYYFNKLLSQDNVPYMNENQLEKLFEHAFNLVVCSKIIKSLQFLIQNLEKIPSEEKICQKLSEKFSYIIKGSNFLEIQQSIELQIKAVEQLVREWAFFKDFNRFKEKIYFTSSPDFILDFFEIVTNDILPGKRLFVLLDEYDELDEYQQKFINKIIRTRKLVLRIASAIRGFKTFEYATGKEIIEIQDYDPPIPLHFNEHEAKYKDLIKKIFEKRLTTHGNYKVTDPSHILPEEKQISGEEIKEELKNIYENLTRKKENTDEKYWKDFEGHYKEAAKYRILRGKGIDISFAGFETYKKLSAGIIRQFILLCREAFSLAYNEGIKIEKGDLIPPKIQTKAAYNVAKELLENETLISSPEGMTLKQLIYDLGRILEYKVYNTTEPQCNLFQINDCNKLSDAKYSNINRVLEEGLKLPHFLSGVAFRPKQRLASISSFTFRINPIFMPLLKVPFQKRWRLFISVEELQGLCTSNHEKNLKDILRRISEGKKLKETKIPETTLLSFSNRTITLENCPITGKGCNQNLFEYILTNRDIKCFLAVPFKEDWVKDPRRWIKQILTDEFRIPCKDVEDFPQLGYILCKICSCVRQMPIGIFEITEVNPNVIFELGMATALNRLTFMLVYKEKIPPELKDTFPPQPFTGIEYIPYELNKNELYKKLEEKIIPTITEMASRSQEGWCWLIKGACPHKEIESDEKVFVGLPLNKNQSFFEECKKIIKDLIGENELKVSFFKQASSLNELCLLCKETKESKYCIIDTSYNDLSMLFALGLAFGMDKEFIHLYNKSLSGESLKGPLSDMKAWTIQYRNTEELNNKLKEEIKKRGWK